MLLLILVTSLSVQSPANPHPAPPPASPVVPPASEPTPRRVFRSPLVPKTSPPEPATAQVKGVDLSARFQIGDSFRYRFTSTERQYAALATRVESTCEGEAIIEGIVKKGPRDAKTKAARSNVEFRYSRIAFKSVTGTEELVIDPATVPTTAPQRAMKRLLDQVMSKTIIVERDMEGNWVGMKGVPLEVFAGIVEYQHADDLRAAGIDQTAAGYEYLSSLGTASMMSWLIPVFKPGEGTQMNVTVGHRWKADGDAGITQLELVEMQGDNAIIRALGGEADALPPKGDPLRVAERYIWDTKAGRLVLWEGSWDSLHMKGGGARCISKWKLELLPLPAENAKP